MEKVYRTRFKAVVRKHGNSHVVTIPNRVILWEHIRNKQEIEVQLVL